MKNKKNEKILWKETLSEYWDFLKKYKGVAIFLFFISLTVESLMIVDKFLFKKIIDDGTEFVAGNLQANAMVKGLTIVAIVYVSIILVRAISLWLKNSYTFLMDSKMMFDIKNKYFNHIVQLDYNFHTTHKTGSMITRLIRGSGSVENMNGVLLYQFAPLFFQLIIVGVSIVYFSWIPAFVLFLTVIVFVSYSFVVQHIQQKYRIIYNKIENREKGLIGDIFTNIDSIKYFGKENVIRKRYSNASNKTREIHVKYESFFKWLDTGQALILAVGTFFIIYFPVKSFLNNELSLGTIVFIFTVYGNVVGPMFGFVWGIRNFYRVTADLQDLFEYGKSVNTIKDKPNAKNLVVKKGEIEFKNLDFNYGKKKAFSLNNFSLKIKKDEKVALVGHSGCGKTTLVKMLYRFYDPIKGVIMIDGEDIRDFNQESVRGELSIVPQECVLFDDTIYNNVKFSNTNATREQVMNAIKFAQLDKVVRNFSQKENTIVGERGIKLSGGEKQRVSIARALLADKKILVLDEATSALDSETEHEIQKALYNLLQGRTSIIIAHRLSTIMSADRIVVMKDGRIIQQGKHAELIRQSGEYKKLWNLQKGGYIKE
ncbi:MAG: ABC transporter ATP-binding protein [Nanoarchaeota archaeon]